MRFLDKIIKKIRKLGRFDEREDGKMKKKQNTEQEINAAIELYRSLTPEQQAIYLTHLWTSAADTPAPAQAVRETSCGE